MARERGERRADAEHHLAPRLATTTPQHWDEVRGGERAKINIILARQHTREARLEHTIPEAGGWLCGFPVCWGSR